MCRRKPIFDFLDDRGSTFADTLNVSSSDADALGKIDAAITAMNEQVKDKLPQSPIILLKLHQTIKKRLDAVKPSAGANTAQESPDSQTEGDQLQIANVAAAGPIGSRAEAYERLSEIADYLAKIEPHSPTPYLVRRAVSWGGMSLSDLLQELVGDNPQGLKALYGLLGIKEPPPNRPPPTPPPKREQPSEQAQPANRGQTSGKS